LSEESAGRSVPARRLFLRAAGPFAARAAKR